MIGAGLGMSVPPPGVFEEAEEITARDADDREPPVAARRQQAAGDESLAVERLTSSTSAASRRVKKLLLLVAVGIAVAGVMTQVSTGGLRPTSNSVICVGPSPGAIQVNRVGRCIYCGASDVKLSREHIILTAS